LLYLIVNYRVFLNSFVELIMVIYVLGDQEIVKTFRMYCPKDCGHSYIGAYRKQNLKRHLLFECGVEPKFQCYLCQKRFRHKSSMNTHLLIIHKICP